jgi:peptidoglycan/LPS O-acetylase OafA/YrhL
MGLDGHLWSLSVEEQFYLIWPWIVLYCRPRTAIWLALTFVAISPFSRAAEYLTGHRAFFWLPSHTDALMAGAILAFAAIIDLESIKKIVAWQPKFMRLATIFLLLLPPFLGSRLLFGKFTVMIGPSIQAICATYLIASFTFQRSGIGFRLLNLSAVSYIGILSYSLYIWQEPFLFAFPFPVPIGLLLTFAVAACSYHFLERPILGLRQTLRPAAPRRSDLVGGYSSNPDLSPPPISREASPQFVCFGVNH